MSIVESNIPPSISWLTRRQNSFSSSWNKSTQISQWREQKIAIRTEIAKRSSYEIERAKAAIAARRKILKYFPEDGPLRRELYPKHMTFFAKGKDYRARLFRAANRIGKTEAAAYELTCHLIGQYPPWWEGYRFTQPIEAWAANISWEKVRDVNQAALMGNPHRPEDIGTGFIPGDMIVRYDTVGFAKNGIGTAVIRHMPTGGTSLLQFKAYTQDRESFESNSKHVIWLDEECPDDIYTACELRTMTVDGLIMLTYTPVMGLTPLTELFEHEADRA